MKLLLLENLKQSITHIVKLFKLNISAAPTGRPRKISKLDSLTLALYQHVSTRTTKRSVYEDLKNTLLCSYKTLVVSVSKAREPCHGLVFVCVLSQTDRNISGIGIFDWVRVFGKRADENFNDLLCEDSCIVHRDHECFVGAEQCVLEIFVHRSFGCSCADMLVQSKGERVEL